MQETRINDVLGTGDAVAVQGWVPPLSHSAKSADYMAWRRAAERQATGLSRGLDEPSTGGRDGKGQQIEIVSEQVLRKRVDAFQDLDDKLHDLAKRRDDVLDDETDKARNKILGIGTGQTEAMRLREKAAGLKHQSETSRTIKSGLADGLLMSGFFGNSRSKVLFAAKVIGVVVLLASGPAAIAAYLGIAVAPVTTALVWSAIAMWPGRALLLPIIAGVKQHKMKSKMRAANKEADRIEAAIHEFNDRTKSNDQLDALAQEQAAETLDGKRATAEYEFFASQAIKEVSDRYDPSHPDSLAGEDIHVLAGATLEDAIHDATAAKVKTARDRMSAAENVVLTKENLTAATEILRGARIIVRDESGKATVRIPSRSDAAALIERLTSGTSQSRKAARSELGTGVSDGNGEFSLGMSPLGNQVSLDMSSVTSPAAQEAVAFYTGASQGPVLQQATP